MTYIDLDESIDEDEILEESLDTMATAFPGWSASTGNLDYWLLQIVARLAATVYAQEGYVSEEIFSRFGEEIIGVAPIAATSATVDSTWTAVDNAGYTIPAGTTVSIAATGSETYAFRVTEQVDIPAGSTATSAGEVTLSAVTPGEDANGLTEDPVLQDAYAWVSTIELTGTTSGGVDAETGEDYLDRLRDSLTLLTLTPVIPADVEILARSVAGVDRVVALDGYDVVGDTYGNDRVVHVVGLDAAGANLSSDVKDEIDELLQDRREVNFTFTIGNATESTVKVTTAVHPRTGWDSATVIDNVEAALTTYLSRERWGTPSFGDPASNGGWINQDTVRRNELIALVDQVEGVDYVSTLTLALQANVLGTSDVSLPGPAPLVTAGTLTVTTV